jgi:hypothetical protein
MSQGLNYVVVTGPTGVEDESDLATCSHCQKQMRVPPAKNGQIVSRVLPPCNGCGKFICGVCKARRLRRLGKEDGARGEAVRAAQGNRDRGLNDRGDPEAGDRPVRDEARQRLRTKYREKCLTAPVPAPTRRRSDPLARLLALVRADQPRLRPRRSGLLDHPRRRGAVDHRRSPAPEGCRGRLAAHPRDHPRRRGDDQRGQPHRLRARERDARGRQRDHAGEVQRQERGGDRNVREREHLRDPDGCDLLLRLGDQRLRRLHRREDDPRRRAATERRGGRRDPLALRHVDVLVDDRVRRALGVRLQHRRQQRPRSGDLGGPAADGHARRLG